MRSWTEVESLGQDNRSSLNALPGGSSQASGALSSKDLQGAVGVLTAGGEIEAGREDGELPSSGMPLLTAGIGGSNLLNGKDIGQDGTPGSGSATHSRKEALDTLSKSTSGERRTRREKTAPVKASMVPPRSSATLGGIGSTLGTEFDALMEDGIDGLEVDPLAEDNMDDFNGSKSRWDWESHGARRYRVVLRRENGPGGKRLELEAQIEVTLEYPLRPPHFYLRILPSGSKDSSALPAPPRGLLDVTETMVIGEVNVDEWFNELRAIEAEVNIHLPAIVPKAEVNHILSHQVALLCMLFDRQVENEVSLRGGMGPSNSSFTDRASGKVGSRTVRGRDRRKAIAWNEQLGNFEHRS